MGLAVQSVSVWFGERAANRNSILSESLVLSKFAEGPRPSIGAATTSVAIACARSLFSSLAWLMHTHQALNKLTNPGVSTVVAHPTLARVVLRGLVL